MLGAGAWQGRRRAGGSGRAPHLLLALFAALRELKDRGLLLAYHDRSDGGVLLTVLEMAFAGHCGLGIDLGAVRRTRSPPALRRNWARCCRCPRPRAAEAREVLARHGLGAADPGYRRAAAPATTCGCTSTARTVYSGVASRSASPLERSVVPHSGDARQSGMRARGVFAARGCGRSGPACAPELRSERRCRGALHLERRAARGRHSARARRQQSDRDGRRVHARRDSMPTTCT